MIEKIVVGIASAIFIGLLWGTMIGTGVLVYRLIAG